MKDSPLRTIKPVVVPAQFYTCGTVAAGFFAVFPAFFAGVITMAVTQKPGVSLGVGGMVCLLVFAGVMALIGWKAFFGPGATTYRIYQDRIEVEEGLVNRQERTVLIDGIIDVRMTSGVLQRTQGAGTVTLVIRPLISQGNGQLAPQSVSLNNIPEPQAIYDLLRTLALDRGGTEGQSPD